MIDVAIRRIVERDSLNREESRAIFTEVMDDAVSDVQKAALLTALRMKGESVEEITGAAEVMRERVERIETERSPLVDTCGTGGDGRGTFNVSTVASIIAAAAGASVAKHGNRAVSSKCGSADLFAGLGVEIDLSPDESRDVLNEVGLAFLFAPRFHPAMKAVTSVRRELGMRTIFNILGPLTNPAMAKRQVLGVYDPNLTETMASVLAHLGSEHVLVVHSEDGLDEISVSAPTRVTELVDGAVRTSTVTPEDLGLDRHDIGEVIGGGVEMNVEIAREILDGKKNARRDLACANAGAAIFVAGLSSSIREGVELAANAIDSGKASEKLDQLKGSAARRKQSDA